MKRKNIKIIKSKKTTPPITEWFKKMNSPRSKLFIYEDNTKYDRLTVLNKIINTPFTPPIKLTAFDVLQNNVKLKAAIKKQGKKECIIRLLPTKANLPKLRKKGGLLKNTLKWFLQQKINPKDYRVEIVSRCSDVVCASIFIVDDAGVWGEITKGGLSQLVTGKFSKKPTIFYFDFKNWYFSKTEYSKELKILKSTIKKLHITDSYNRAKLKNNLASSFTTSNYLKGYFEITVWPKEGIKFVDYNRMQAKVFKEFDVWESIKSRRITLYGIGANQGKRIGSVRIIDDHQKNTKLKNGEILVCKMLSIHHLPLMKRSKAIIVERGNVLCHAILICRELNKPCIIQVKNATKQLKNGDRIIVDANKGMIEIIKN